MKKLGDLILPNSIQWMDRYAFSPIVQTLVYTLDGTPVVSSGGLSGGLPITLVAEKSVTWLDSETLDALLVLAAQPGASFPLIWEAFSCTVMFRHHEPPALALKPLWPDHDQYVGTIKLMVI